MVKDSVYNGEIERAWEAAQQEIETLIAAANSYAASAALNPEIDFQQHLTTLITMGELYLFPARYVN